MSTKTVVNGGHPPIFLDDNERAAAVNGQPATAALITKEIALLNQIAHSGRPIFSWYGANAQVQPPLVDHTSTYRTVYLAANLGAAAEGGLMMGMQHDEASPPGFQTGQGFRVRVGGTDYNTFWSYSTSPATTWPGDMRTFRLSSNFGTSTIPTELTIGSVTSDFPQPKAGTYWQNPENLIDPASQGYVGLQDVHAAGDIVGVNTGSAQQSLSTLVSVFRDTWFHQRTQIGWSLECPGQFSSLKRAANFSTSPQQLRFIFDQSYGVGGNTFVNGGPGITLPLANAAAGLRTAIRVYVFVWAAMSGGTDTGSLGVSNKTAHNTVAGTPVALTNPVTITTGAFQWYPTLATWTPATGMYFNGFTGDAYDRIALCAKSSGATDTVVIGAFALIVMPATS